MAKMKDNIVSHYPLLSGDHSEDGDKRTLCGEQIRTDKWIDGRKTYHMFTDLPNELGCKECRKIARDGGLVRYKNSDENPLG